MNIAVSACLLGEPCRYDGASKPCEAVVALSECHELVPVCPEVSGGLDVPHAPCEVVASERALRVVDAEGCDVTEAFMGGAQATLDQIKTAGCKLAIFKAKSPSCGSGLVYDGTFSRTLVPGYGVAARLLRQEGIRVLDELQLQDILVVSQARHPDALPGIFAETSAECPVLETERLVLRALVPEDAEDTFAYCSDPDIGADAGWPVHRSIEDSQTFIAEIAAAPHTFGIFEKTAGVKAPSGQAAEARGSEASAADVPAPSQVKTGPCIGSVGFMPDPRRKNPDCLMLGYALAKSAWGKGYMTEAAREVLRYGFEELGLSMVSVTHYTFNERSGRVIEKCGFRREGIMRAAEPLVDGIMEDMVLYSVTAEEAVLR